MEKIVCGIIGAGRIGQLHASLLKNHVEGAEIKTICDIDIGFARDCAEKVNCTSWTNDYRKIFSDPEINAVIICSSTDTHVDMIRKAAVAGKNIFCEKPISFDIKTILETLKVVESSGVSLQIGFNRRFDPNFSELYQIVRRGDIGDTHIMRITSRDPSPPPIDYIKRSGGLFMDMTIHDFDMARYLSGSEVVEVYARGAVLVDEKIGETGDIDTAVINLLFKNGSLGIIENSRKAVYGYDQRVELFGSKGRADAENIQTNTITIASEKGIKKDLPPFFFIERYTESYIQEFRHFIKCLIEGEKPSVTGIDALEPVYIARACQISVKENRPVLIEEIKK